jgi:predicted alpha/beta-hydrolase family hydrolase
MISIEVQDGQRVSALLEVPKGARACYVVAHGAGAGMTHPFMSAVAEGLAGRSIATLRYQFPYMERRAKRPDPPHVAHAAVRAAVAEAARQLAGMPLFAGGKSFGGRMTSQAQASQPMPGVRGLVFLGFPLHPAGKRSDERARHLVDVKVPMLFLQGGRDSLADLALMRRVVENLGERAMLEVFAKADHSFRGVALEELLDRLARWISEHGALADRSSPAR